ncbi:unnamed protein product [Schistosoma margrebowiei]|nr:unnamed protein product [Schistosoma margrebowiei]
MTFYDVSKNVRKRRATVNLSASLGCHRTTYNRRWKRMRAALMKKYDFLSFSEFANESTLKEVKTDINCNDGTSTVTPSTNNINQRLEDNSGSPEVDLCSHNFVNRKQLMNDFMMYLVSNTSLSIRDADRVLYGLRFLIPDIPKSIRGVLKTCPSVQPKFIGSGVYYHLGLKTNTSTDENTLPLNTEKPKRGVMKRKEDFLYNSVDMDVAEMQAKNVPVQYPKFRVFEKFISPIANSTQLETSPSTSECKHVGGAIVDHERLCTLVLNMSSAISELTKTINNMSSAVIDLNANVNQLLSKFHEREKPHRFDCGLSSQQFPLSSEEELQMLDTSLSQKETRDRFMAMVTRLSSDDPKASMRFVLSYLLTPKVASKFTLLGTSSKRALQKCTFYGCIRSNLYLLLKLQVL